MAEIKTNEQIIQNTDELNILLDNGATYSNEFFVGVLEGNNLFRLTFTERNNDTKKLHHRSSILLSRNGITNLMDMLIGLQQSLAEQDKQLAQLMDTFKRNVQPTEEASDLD